MNKDYPSKADMLSDLMVVGIFMILLIYVIKLTYMQQQQEIQIRGLESKYELLNEYIGNL